MRPLQLSMEGFGAFRERTTVDFTGLALFAIAGPTGAGKSTLLDAITFSLFGKVPRLGVQVGELISLGLERAQVSLEFTAAGRRFLVTRTLRRGKGKSGEALLEELGTSTPRTATGVKEVNARLQGVLGLNYEAFTQAVLLPQGEFARFLKSPAAERRAILRELLRLNVYERMREMAQERRAGLTQEVAGLHERLREEHANASPEHLATATARRTQCEKTRTSLLAAVQEQRTQLEQARAQAQLSSMLVQLRDQLARLDAQNSDVEQQAKALAAHHRAVPIQAVMERALAAQAAAQSAGLAHAKARDALDLAQQEHQEAQDVLGAAQRATADVATMDARVRALDELTGLWRVLFDTQQHLEGAQQAVSNARTRLASAQHNHQDHLAAAVDAQAVVARCEAEVHNTPVPALAAPLLPQLQSTVERATSLHNTLQRAGAALDHARARVTKAQQDHATNASHLAAVTLDRSEKDAALAAAQAQLDKVTQEHAALHLRKTLAAGEACPVCGQDVAAVPKSKRVPALTARQNAVATAITAAEQARHALAQAQAAAAATQSVLEELQRVLDERHADHTAASVALAEATALLEEHLGRTTPAEAARRVQDAVVGHARHQQALTALGQARRMMEMAHASRDATALQVQVAREEDARATLVLTTLETRVAQLQAQLHDAGGTADPQAERARLVLRLGEVRDALARAQERQDTLARTLEQATRTRDETALLRQRAQQEADKAGLEAETAARSTGFPLATLARQALLPEAAALAMASRVEAHRRQREDVAQQLAQLEKRTGPGPAKPLLQLEAALQQAEADLNRAQEDAAAAVQDERLLATRVEQAAALRTRLTVATGALALHETLALDLRSDRFQAFLLQETFAQLLEGASLKLWDLTGRYTFELREEQFFVVDHDHARERRSADTLSGGETFLASLALALELSDHVQRLAGATALDSLFIDEGFGTLDGEALDVAASAVEGLPTGGRMVGIVTHVQALTDRLPARLVVEKSAQGARVHRITGA